MLALCPGFHAALTTTFFKELLDTGETLSFRMTESQTNMSTSERNSTTLSTAWGPLIAEGLLVLILAAGTSLGDWFQARRAGPEMAS
jgi:hypothetical protein